MTGATLVAADIRSTTERRMVEEWAREHHPAASVVALEDPGFDAAVAANQMIRPVRVTWLPQERGSGERLKLSELALLSRPRRPWQPVQQVLSYLRPDRAKITIGSPATVEDLLTRYRDRHSRDDATRATISDSRFAAFVGRQALLACDQAERQVLGNRYKIPHLIAEQLMDDPSFEDGLEQLGEQLGEDPGAVREKVVDALDELVAVQSPLVIDLWDTILRPLHTHAWSVACDDSTLDAIKEIGKEHSLIFLPSHRSYADPLILSDVLLRHDFPRNHTLGGANLSFWPFGALGKRAGIVFIRRSFGGDDIYKFAVRRYLAHLMAKRFNLEWFMEGGRTRTGKLRRPKYGILRYLVDGLEIQPTADPVIIPVSLVYEQLHEVASMAEEEQGGTKQAEGITWFLRYVRNQRTKAGDVLVRFGEPLPLRQALADAGEGPAQLEKVAFRVATRINAVTPATSTSLVTMVLLGERDRALTLEEICHRVTPLLDYLDARGIERPTDDLHNSPGVRATLDRLAEAGVVDLFDDGPTCVWSIPRNRQHTAAFYRNGAAHHLLNRAIVELSLLYVVGLPEGIDHLEKAFEEAMRLRDLLKFEFFFPDKGEYREQLRAELKLLSPTWNLTDGRSDQAERVLLRALQTADDGTSTAPAGPLVAHHVLRSFIDAQAVSAAVLVAAGGGTTLSETDVVDRSLSLGQQMFRQRQIHGSETVSRELFGGTARMAANRDLLAGGPSAQARREAYRDELADVLARLQRISEMDRASLDHSSAVNSPSAAGPAVSAPEVDTGQIQRNSDGSDLTVEQTMVEVPDGGA